MPRPAVSACLTFVGYRMPFSQPESKLWWGFLCYDAADPSDRYSATTGQLATDPDDDSRPLPPGIEAQTRKVFDNLQRALAGADAGFEHVVCVRIFLTR